jgi:hypothetical protein
LYVFQNRFMASQQNDKNEVKKRQVLLTDIQSNDNHKVLKAIQSMEAHGHASIVEPMLAVWFKTEDEEIDQAMQNFFGDLKDSTTSAAMMEFLNATDSSDFRRKILTAIWNSKVDYSNYLKDFVRLAAEGDFLEALECLTVIENLDGPFPEDQFLESQLHLKNYLENRKESTDHKAELMSEIAMVIREFEKNQFDV